MGHKVFPSRGVPIYPSSASFPESSQGDLAVSLADNALYEYDGSAWASIASASSISAVSDTNTIDLTASAGTLSADVNYQNGASIAFSDSASGLSAEVSLSAASAEAAYFNSYTTIETDGLHVQVPYSGVRTTKLLGYSIASGTVASTDTVLQGFNKIGYYISQHDEAQIVTVATSGAQYTTITAALAAITDASSTKPYVIEVGPGVYTENVTLKDWVFIQNGLSGAVTIVGKVTGTGLTGTCGMRGITVQYTATGDNQIAVELSGGIFYLVDCDIYLLGAADYIVTGVKATSGTAFTIFNSTVWDRRSGNITKALSGWEFAGTGTFGIFNASTSARAAYTGGTSCLFSITGTGSFTMSGGAGIWASSSAFSGEIRGFCCTSATSANPRVITNTQIRMTGTSGGTATGSHLDSGGNNGRIDISGCVFNISGFNTEQITNTDTSDSQRIYLSTTNKFLTKTGTGLASVTPLDLVQTGFVAWTGTGAYFSYVVGTGVLTLSRACIGMVKGSQVYIASGQTVTCTNFQNNFIYADSAGVLQVTTDPGFEDKVILFSLYSDGTNYSTTKQTHPVSYPSATSGWAHNALGSSMKNDSNGVVTLLSGAGRTIQLVGASTYYDHGLNTTIADSAGGAISMLMMYTGASGATFQGAAFTAIPGVKQDGTTLSNVGNGKFVNYRIGVYPASNADDTAANTIAQYLIVPDSTEHNSASAAAAQITANTVAAFPTVATGGLEVINIGFATIQGNGAGAGTLTVVTPAKQVFGVNFASGSSSSAGTVTTDTTNFDKNLSATDTSVQIALNTLDEFNALPNNSTNTSGSPDLTNKTTFASAATGTTATFTFDARGAIEFLVDVNTDGGMTIACDYKSTIINAISDPSSLFLATDSGTGIYISKSANSAVVSLKNNMGATKTIGVLAVRSPITAATAWS